ncbi:NUDIX domain-containing protein [Prauserella cavernicola]|uniref:NUDIX hydrolase n=1 Tax=Prauserella cavernicola TaxID=2800127 RepID=A0A934QRG9_9PSEU|nr:NUDIX hydrolase [Prauserella cavernicola]MBK1784103.1 NUDIX hydrolase [Prauserella cavernicola]
MELLPFDAYVRSLDRKRMSAGVLFRDHGGRVLLVEPSYKPFWDLPGGAVDSGEAPWTAARREVREELGFDGATGRILVVDHVTANGPLPEGIGFVFDGGVVTEAEVRSLPLTDPEIVSVALCTLDEVAARTGPRLLARVRAAVRAAQRDELALCENGVPVTG